LCGEERPKTKRFYLINTLTKNIDGDLVEAVAFAWLAFAYDHQINSNMPAVTGASKACTLGTCFTP
jgi:anhydro-N-acetylmuramic acid kinase